MNKITEKLLEVMDIPKSKLGLGSSEISTVVNMKYSEDMFMAFGRPKGVYPAYHMNKLHWISVLLPDAPEDIIQFLVNVSFEATKEQRKRRKA